jgi:hypothetical protein
MRQGRIVAEFSEDPEAGLSEDAIMKAAFATSAVNDGEQEAAA